MSIDSYGSTKNPASDADLGGAMSFILKKALGAANGQLPARVLSYNRDTNTARVQTLIMMQNVDGETMSRGAIANVPVLALGCQVGGEGFVINFPIKAGTVGWLRASDRDISLFRQSSLQEAPPATLRMKSFEDGMFIPDVFNMFNLTSEDAEALVIQSVGGETRIAIEKDELRITSSRLVKVTSPNVEIIGNVKVTGDVTVVGSVTASVEVTAKGIGLTTHKHGGVQPGSGQSGPAVP